IVPARGMLEVDPRLFNQSRMLLNVANGTFDFETGTLRAPNPADMLTQMIPIPWNPDARAPRWERALLEIFQGREDVWDLLQRPLGYSLTGNTSEQVGFIHHGAGNNGKTTVLDVVRKIIGEEYGCMVSPEVVLSTPRHFSGRGAATPDV